MAIRKGERMKEIEPLYKGQYRIDLPMFDVANKHTLIVTTKEGAICKEYTMNDKKFEKISNLFGEEYHIYVSGELYPTEFKIKNVLQEKGW